MMLGVPATSARRRDALFPDPIRREGEEKF